MKDLIRQQAKRDCKKMFEELYHNNQNTPIPEERRIAIEMRYSVLKRRR